jgi:hypothetical protein
MKMVNFHTEGEFTAQYLLISALHHLYHLVEFSQKTPIDLLPIPVFMAFSIESYINNLSKQHLENWEEIERCPWKEKLRKLHQKRNKPIKLGESPLQFASEIFNIRDKLAHGKPDKPVVGPSFTTFCDAQHFIEQNDIDPKWFTDLDYEWFKKSQRQFAELMEYLSLLFGSSPTNYFHASTKRVTGPH